MQWLIIAVVLFIIASLFFQRRERPRREPERVILSSPRVTNLPDTFSALSALGLDVSKSYSIDTEVDLIRGIALRLWSRSQDFGPGFQELVQASGGLLRKADQVTLQVALLDFELSPADELPLLNAQLDPSKGQFFYVSEEDDRVVFLTPSQVQALTVRGWRFQDPPTTYGTPPNPPIERTEPVALLLPRGSSE